MKTANGSGSRKGNEFPYLFSEDRKTISNPDFAKLILNKPTDIKSEDAPDGIKITHSENLKLYKHSTKDEPVENGDNWGYWEKVMRNGGLPRR